MSERSRSIEPTGITTCDTAGRVGGVHVLGVLHGQPLATARVTGAITRYDPDVVAIVGVTSMDMTSAQTIGVISINRDSQRGYFITLTGCLGFPKRPTTMKTSAPTGQRTR